MDGQAGPLEGGAISGDRLASCANGHFMAACTPVPAVDTLSPSVQWAQGLHRQKASEARGGG